MPQQAAVWVEVHCAQVLKGSLAALIYVKALLWHQEKGVLLGQKLLPPPCWRQGCGSSVAEDQSSPGGTLDAGSRAHRCCRNKSKDIS